jgi:hypothetical protein
VALIRSVQIFVVGAYNKAARAALGADQPVDAFEIGYQANVGACVVMDEPFIAEPGRPAGWTSLAKSRQRPALRTKLYPVVQERGENADPLPLLQQLKRQTQAHFK